MKKIVLVLAVITMIGCGGGGSTKTTDTENDHQTQNPPFDNRPETHQNTRHKIFLIGDSTVNYINLAGESKVGWGNVIDSLLKHSEDLTNRARPGSSARVYRFDPNDLPQNLNQTIKESIYHDLEVGLYGEHRDLYWAKTKALLSQVANLGDFLLIQFGSGNDHFYYNTIYPRDSDLDGDGDVDQDDRNYRIEHRRNDFKSALKFYINQAREMGLVPILITNPNNRAFRNNRIQNWREPFYSYTKEVAQEENVRLLDLNKKSREEYQRLYDEAGQSCEGEINQKFGACNIHDENVDAVHFYEEGARIVAGWVRDLACEDAQSELCRQFEGH